MLRAYNLGLKIDCLWDEALLYYRLHDSNTIREKPLAAIRENTMLLLRIFPGLSKYLNALRLNGLQIQLQDLYRYTHEEWQTCLHLRLTDKERELFPLIEDRDQWVAERDEIIHQQVSVITERDRWVADRDRWIKERDGLIIQLRLQMEQQQKDITERESWLTDRDEMISKRDQWVADRDRWVAERDQWLAEREHQLQEVIADRDRLLNSWSYRFGSLLLNPLRLLSGRSVAGKVGQSHA